MNRFEATSNKLFSRALRICLTLWVLLTVMFFWGECLHLNWDNKIDHEKFASYFTCVGFLVGVCSIVGLFLQVSTAEKEKHDAVKPLLLPKQAVISTTSLFGLKSPAKPPFVFVSEDYLKCFVILNGRIPIQNVGMGLAKRAKFYWKYDKEELTDFVKLRSEKREDEDEKAALEEVMSYLSRISGKSKIMNQVQVIGKEETINIRTPYHYILGLLNPYKYVSTSRFPDKRPKLTLVMEYQGAFDKKERQEFNVLITPDISVDDSGKSDEVYRIDFLEIPDLPENQGERDQ